MSQAHRSPQGRPLPLEPELRQVLGQANLEYGPARDEAAAFRRLTLALERQSPERGLRPWLWVCAGVGAAALVMALVQGQLLQGSSGADSAATLRLAPEPPSVAPRKGGPAQDVASAAPAEPAPELAPEREGALLPDPPLRARPARAPLSRDELGTSRPRRAALPAPAEADCLALARDGLPQPAERCFERRAQGTGLSAEMALYELARLRRDVLGDVEGALGALGDYRQRFPAGSLRNEVDVSRIELLARAKRGQEALQASEQLLATPAGRERAAELRLLRGNVYRASGALREAIDEYASAERLGGSLGEEAAFLRGQCLEALGEVAAAHQAYVRAAQSPGPRRSEAQQRLDVLRAGP